MSPRCGFGRFVGLDEHDVPDLLTRLSKRELGVDGERYGIESRLFARPGASVSDLATAVATKLIRSQGIQRDAIGALVLSSRIVDVDDVSQQVAQQLRWLCPTRGIERACSGFPAATDLARRLCAETGKTVIAIAAEIISQNINWEPPSGDSDDNRRARGQASKLFGDGAAAVAVGPLGNQHPHEILDAWVGEVSDDDQLIQKVELEDTRDPWGNVRSGVTGCVCMPGRRGFYLVKRAPRIMADSIQTSLERVAEVTGRPSPQRPQQVVPHQANGLILGRLQSELSGRGNEDVRVWDCIERSGNTVSASIPLAMTHAQDSIPADSLLAMPSVGAGGPGYRPNVLSTGCVLVQTGPSG